MAAGTSRDEWVRPEHGKGAGTQLRVRQAPSPDRACRFRYTLYDGLLIKKKRTVAVLWAAAQAL